MNHIKITGVILKVVKISKLTFENSLIADLSIINKYSLLIFMYLFEVKKQIFSHLLCSKLRFVIP